MSQFSHPHLVLGTGLLGMTLEKPGELEQLLHVLRENQIDQIETAPRYPPLNPGLAEKILGDAKVAEMGFQVDTKIFTAARDGSGELSASSITKSIQESFERLQVKKVNTLYCHCYDPTTPLAETAEIIDTFYKRGIIKRWGVCRFEPEQLQELLNICDQRGFIKPQVYQGEYNVVTRAAEDQIIPIVRAHQMRFYAHRPFATGFLTGKFSQGKHEGTRFADEFPINFVFREEYGTQELHNAIEKLETILKPYSVSCIEAALRWIMFHSALTTGDGVVFGCSSVQQSIANMESVRKGPLPGVVASSIDRLWTEFAKQSRNELL